jgi:hypothetical protein
MIENTREKKRDDLREINRGYRYREAEDQERGIGTETKMIVGIEFVLASYYILALIDIVPMF